MRIVAIFGATLAAVTLSVAAASGGEASAVKEGGTFRVAVWVGSFGGIDPALNVEDRLVRPACGALMAFPHKRLPEGLRLEPELAEAEPVVSRDGKTYTFDIRKDARFSTGAAVTARAFVHALERILTPGMDSSYADFFLDVVGARKMLAGKATILSGAVAQGKTLTIRLTKRVPDFLARTRWICAVPASLPADPEGAKAPLPSAAPYYAAQYIPGERPVLERNRFYRGERPHHVDRFDADLASDPGSIVDEIASGKVEYGVLRATEGAERSAELAQRYGVNRSQFFVVPGGGVRFFVLNTSRPLFRNNVKLRQAVNFAVDRKALVRELGAYAGRATDQYLPPATPGFRDERIYPLEGPDLRTARALAAGRRRAGTAVLYTPNLALPLATAQIVQQNLRAIGLEVEIEQFPPGLHFQKLVTPGEPFDIGYVGMFDLTADQYLNAILDDNLFNSPKYKQLLDRASRLSRVERYRAYGELDVQLSRDAAPAIPFAALNALTFVSANVGCIVLNPGLDLTAVCLK